MQVRFEAVGDTGDEGIFVLVDTPLFARLRVFHIADNALSVEGMKVLTRARAADPDAPPRCGPNGRASRK